MKVKEYLETHKKILEPIHEIPTKIAVLGIIESIAEEYRGDFYGKLIRLLKEERNNLENIELTLSTDSQSKSNKEVK